MDESKTYNCFSDIKAGIATLFVTSLKASRLSVVTKMALLSDKQLTRAEFVSVISSLCKTWYHQEDQLQWRQ